MDNFYLVYRIKILLYSLFLNAAKLKNNKYIIHVHICIYAHIYYIYIHIYIYIYMYISMYIYIYDSKIVHHNTCFDLFILRNNSFDNQRSEMKKKTTFFYVSTYCLLPKLSSYSSCNWTKLQYIVAIEIRVVNVNAEQIHYQSKYMSFSLTQSSGK